MNVKSNPARALGVFSIIMITVGSVDSVRNLPTTALFGSSLIFFFTLGALLFLLPAALVSAELASASTESGGIYNWIKEAFGPRAGFLAVWFQWAENIVWYPAILSFVAGSIGYLMSPELVQNKTFLMTIILSAFWITTFINLLGMNVSAWFSTLCAISGLIIPMILIISLGILWLIQGHPLQIHFTSASILPHFNQPQTWVALTGIMLSFGGIEIATVHAGDVENPQRAYPLAMLISTIVILITLVLGSLSIAIVLPEKQISLVAGLMQAFTAFFEAYHLGWILPLIAIMLVIGGMGSVNNWIIAPTRGLLVAAKDGMMPKHFQKENRFGAPVTLLIYQAVIVTFIAMAFLLMPSVNGSYWLLTALAAQLYMIMYLMMFVACVRLRYKKTNDNRHFQIPGGNWGVWIIAAIGCMATVGTLILGFIPPDTIQVGSTAHYEKLLIAGLILMSLPPFLFRSRKSENS